PYLGLHAPLRLLDRLLARVFQRTIFSHTDFDPRLVYGSWLFLAVMIFTCLHLLGRTARLRLFLWNVAAVVTIAGFLYVDYFFENSESHVVAGVFLRPVRGAW